MTSFVDIDQNHDDPILDAVVDNHHRPSLYRLMKAASMDKHYYKASGAYLYHLDHEQQPVRVIDFAGGYGSTFFGHNPKPFKKLLQQQLAEDTPIHTQGSVRRNTVVLADRLHQAMHAKTGQDYAALFANSGAEAVDMALKHCTLNWHKTLRGIHADCQSHSDFVRSEKLAHSLTWSPEALEQLQQLGMDTSNANHNPEAVIAQIRQFNNQAIQRSCRFLALTNAFHGKTVGATQLTYNASYRSPFSHMGPQVDFVAPEDLAALEQQLTASPLRLLKISEHRQQLRVKVTELCDVAGFFVEPIQGEGGVRVINEDYLHAAFTLCRRHNVAIVMDEIQTGLGRTGDLLYSLRQGLIADYYLLSKALGAGLCKISAMLVHHKRYCSDFEFIHTSTFADDDLSSAVASKVIDTLERGTLYDKAKELGSYLRMALNNVQQRYPEIIQAVRGEGLLMGVQFNLSQCDSGLLALMARSGLLSNAICGHLLNVHRVRVATTLSDPSTIRIEPPVCISQDDIETLANGLKRICVILARKNGYELIKPLLGIPVAATADITDFSQQHRPVRIPPPTVLPRVGFITHLLSASDWRHFDPSLAEVDSSRAEAFMAALIPHIEPLPVTFQSVTSATGEQVEIVVYGLCMSSSLIAAYLKKRRPNPVHDLVQRAVEQAQQDGCKVVGFGGLNSIVAQNCKAIHAPNQVLTTGNAFTVAMGLRAIESCVEQAQLSWCDLRVAIVGALGNICSVYTEIMADKASQLLLIGRANSLEKLQAFAKTLYRQQHRRIEKAVAEGTPDQLTGIAKSLWQSQSYQRLRLQENSLQDQAAFADALFEALNTEFGQQAPIRVEQDLQALQQAQVIVTASNSPEPIIYPAMLNAGPVYICDIAMPPDVDTSVHDHCNNVQVFKGGMVKLADNPEFAVNGLLLPPGQTLACLTETLLLGLERHPRHFSYGNITPRQVEWINALGAKHGFVLGNLSVDRSF